MLYGMGRIPALNIGAVELRRVDILSDLRPKVEQEDYFSRATPTPLEIDEADYEIDMQQLHATITHARELLAQHTPPHQEAEPSQELLSGEHSPFSAILEGVKLTHIENFDTTATNPYRRLYTKLYNPASTIRIAFLGDSFVEGDILSGDLRQCLQDRFGGVGAGFAPFDTPLTRFRRTIKTTSHGWTTYNIMQRATTPEYLASHHFVSGWVSEPQAGAVTRWEGTEARRHLTSWRRARLLFMSPKDSNVEVVINDTIAQVHKIEGSELLQQLMFTQDSISSLSVEILSGAEGFVGYGAIFDGSQSGGVSVDNYSVRSNNGQAILWTNPAINFQVDHVLGGYDLVILQYGLNIMQRGVTSYTRYSAQMEKIIEYVRECFPSAAVLVMGVSDRSTKEAGVYRPMGEAVQMTRYQRQAAYNTQAAFWSTYDAMQAQGGMAQFVKHGWAGKDYTHINFAGGRQVAYALCDALLHDMQKYTPDIERHDYNPIVSPESRVVK